MLGGASCVRLKALNISVRNSTLTLSLIGKYLIMEMSKFLIASLRQLRSRGASPKVNGGGAWNAAGLTYCKIFSPRDRLPDKQGFPIKWARRLVGPPTAKAPRLFGVTEIGRGNPD